MAEYTGYAEALPLKDKTTAAPVLIQLLDKWEKATGKQVARVRSDRGREFLNQQLTAAYAARGIDPELTAAYSPESNGVAERYNRTILEKVRCMLVDADAPEEFWAEALLYAAILRNVLPAKRQPVTPHEAFRGVRPDLSLIRVFGSLAHVHIPKAQRGKLEPRSRQAMLLSVDPVSKISRVMFPDEEVKDSRDVVCDETRRAFPIIFGDGCAARAPGGQSNQGRWAPALLCSTRWARKSVGAQLPLGLAVTRRRGWIATSTPSARTAANAARPLPKGAARVTTTTAAAAGQPAAI